MPSLKNQFNLISRFTNICTYIRNTDEQLCWGPARRPLYGAPYKGGRWPNLLKTNPSKLCQVTAHMGCLMPPAIVRAFMTGGLSYHMWHSWKLPVKLLLSNLCRFTWFSKKIHRATSEYVAFELDYVDLTSLYFGLRWFMWFWTLHVNLHQITSDAQQGCSITMALLALPQLWWQGHSPAIAEESLEQIHIISTPSFHE